MGAGIAQIAAESGFDVVLNDVQQQFVDRGRQTVQKQWERAVERGKLEQADLEAAAGRLRTSTDLADMADRDFVLEAIPEVLELKQELFRKLGDITRADCVLSTNTSSLPVAALAGVTKNPERVLGTHFFNPPAVLKLVEVVSALTVDEQYVVATEQFLQAIGKTTIRAKDTPAFVVNRIAVPFFLDAARLLENGVATAEDIDKGCQLGLSHALGPLATMDLIGLDTMVHVAEALYEEYGQDMFKAPPIMRRLVAAGRLGRKSGRGFFEY
jgi:3-hydroxybutyryl-CoA dehydrogenase